MSRLQQQRGSGRGPAWAATAESCQAAAGRGGLASPSGRDIKGGGWEEDNSLFWTEQEGSFGGEWLSRERQSLLEEEGGLQGGRTCVVQQMYYNVGGIEALPHQSGNHRTLPICVQDRTT